MMPHCVVSFLTVWCLNFFCASRTWQAVRMQIVPFKLAETRAPFAQTLFSTTFTYFTT
jgi:hypothetical protein